MKFQLSAIITILLFGPTLAFARPGLKSLFSSKPSTTEFPAETRVRISGLADNTGAYFLEEAFKKQTTWGKAKKIEHLVIQFKKYVE